MMRKGYTAKQFLAIESMGSLSLAVANRWMMGWPDRVAGLFAAGTYFDCLASQVEREKQCWPTSRTSAILPVMSS